MFYVKLNGNACKKGEMRTQSKFGLKKYWLRTYREFTDVGFPTSSIDGFLKKDKKNAKLVTVKLSDLENG